MDCEQSTATPSAWLYVGMMYDIIAALNLMYYTSSTELFIIDLVDLSYGQFVEGKSNSWETLKEKIKYIVLDGFYIDPYIDPDIDIKEINKFGKAIILSENDQFSGKKRSAWEFDELHEWSMKVQFNDKIINIVFYAGYSTEEKWPSQIKNIGHIIRTGSYFLRRLNWCDDDIFDIDECDETTVEMIRDRCIKPLTIYDKCFNKLRKLTVTDFSDDDLVQIANF